MDRPTPENDAPKTYSVQLRLRRVTHEDASVSVLMDDKVMQRNADGTGKIDWEKLVAEAVRVSQTPGVDWRVESSGTAPHPLQSVRPDHRTVVESFYLPE